MKIFKIHPLTIPHGKLRKLAPVGGGYDHGQIMPSGGASTVDPYKFAQSDPLIDFARYYNMQHGYVKPKNTAAIQESDPQFWG